MAAITAVATSAGRSQARPGAIAAIEADDTAVPESASRANATSRAD
jgi:hypothetical protein